MSDPYSPDEPAAPGPMFDVPPPPGVAGPQITPQMPQAPLQGSPGLAPPAAHPRPNVMLLGVVGLAGIIAGYLVHKEMAGRRK